MLSKYPQTSFANTEISRSNLLQRGKYGGMVSLLNVKQEIDGMTP